MRPSFRTARPMEITRLDADSATTYFVHTDVVNWVLLEQNGELTLIDGGYPGQAGQVIESINRIGRRPEDIRGALLTHAHVDHLGGLAKLQARYGFPVYMDPVEVDHALRHHLQQANALDLAPLVGTRRLWSWLAKTTPLGVLSRAGLSAAESFPGKLDLPGSPVPVASHGHTDGHSSYLVGDGRALVSGDALVSGHEVSAIVGPQCIPSLFQHDEATARRSVERFTELDAELLLAGHGPLYRGSVADAAHRALAL
ncbi:MULTISPECIES: MBL fold metallo-hydrolase [Gordonia]|jgi:glyoxylase-like metal-dependent hydrolase (beta-lactamase superfamily II)|uniref:Beta-lactamase n=1 Tax=Gordonia alkanivorans CGMCC 6845 TaxID=1423140 RepID=W9DE24_9ACTN|nr:MULTISPECIES: MBL fold metallo-hydrolase [Gordonia]ETA07748.1 beta-lactamase [Gordonia alkanivorans CGMCC 6845]MDH3007610.1 MBL fold metallo-hydrolase [Gordonia alkanivorans]MDH3015205.1 MBL fold metallo-hydrolase [Gordonia alkanivorans]MDH3024260.1 MBL fold metallo-hydrolase [Gordonia alkanivorans]MDH3039985.1 MBL fold metallo-hydrolase [Gordonia alkanivorans]